MESKTEQNPRPDSDQSDTQGDKEQAPVPVSSESEDTDSIFGSVDTEQVDQVAIDEDIAKQNETLSSLNLPNDVEVDASVVRAFSDYEEAETNPQACEFYDCPEGDDFARNGRFQNLGSAGQ